MMGSRPNDYLSRMHACRTEIVRQIKAETALLAECNDDLEAKGQARLDKRADRQRRQAEIRSFKEKRRQRANHTIDWPADETGALSRTVGSK
jgi:hypothetical protein